LPGTRGHSAAKQDKEGDKKSQSGGLYPKETPRIGGAN
jgi:hypothetical protein